MNRHTFRLINLFLGCLLAAFSAGCGGSRQPVVYYNLTPLTTARGPQAADGTQNPMAVGIGPVVFPDALSRAQIASRLDPQRLKYNDFHRWSGALADNFADVLMEDIAAQLPTTASVAVFPWGGYFRPTHRLFINVSRFDGKLNDEVALEARWSLTNASGKETMLTRKSSIQVKVTGNDYQDLVSAQSQAVAELSEEITAALAGK